MSAPQSYKNHTRFDPPFHFFVVPLCLLNIVFSIYVTVHTWPHFKHTHLWWIVMSVVLLVLAAVARRSALRAQDRTIRLEERIRLATLLTPAEAADLTSLTMQQMVALRFASDEELPALAQRAVRENLTSKQIKQSVVSWRADEHRV